MIPLYTQEEFILAKSSDKLPLQCEHCGKTFYTQKRIIKDKRGVKKFCSFSCLGKSTLQKTTINCKLCNKEFLIKKSQLKKGKNHFCSISCNAQYNNSHKTHGTNRSKLEIWIEKKLSELYPNLKILYNDTTAINSELDIYIPKIKLAFELNGIFHFEPIFGNEKLEKSKNNDNKKFQKCIKSKISLCIIDTSTQKYFKENSSKKYLDIITNIISKNI